MAEQDCELTIKTLYGNYEWFSDVGKYGEIELDGYKKYMVQINVKMSYKLFSEIDIIEIYDNTGFLIQYSIELKELNELNYEFLFPIDKKLMESELKVYFKKFLPIDEKKIFSRRPMKIINTQIIKIPFLKI
jgi:hypothetical protein